MIEVNQIYNEHCFETMNYMEKNSIDLIITSPFYNTNAKAKGNQTLRNCCESANRTNSVRYDEFVDVMSNDEYCQFTKQLFDYFDKILVENGAICYNISYGSENTEGMFRAINEIITNTNFTIADVISWKKKNAIPNNTSSNKLTRICEFVFVFCRKNEFRTFHCNKQVMSVSKNGQKRYENLFNFIEAPNNDGACPLNRATYSSELVDKLLSLYAPNNAVVYDPFMGSGTTAYSCKKNGYSFIGSELSKAQCEWANDRIAKLDNTIGEFMNEFVS